MAIVYFTMAIVYVDLVEFLTRSIESIEQYSILLFPFTWSEVRGVATPLFSLYNIAVLSLSLLLRLNISMPISARTIFLSFLAGSLSRLTGYQ